MVDVAGVRGLGVPGVDWEMRSLQPFEDPKRRLDDVQERLAVLTADRPLRSAEVFVGRKCEVCGLVKLTRLVDGVRTCSPCSVTTLPTDESDAGGSDGVKTHRGFFHRHRKAS